MSDTSQDMAPKPAPRRRFADAPRWVRIALIASLAANVLVLGVFAGSAWRIRHAMAHSGAIGVNLAGYASTLPAERRAMLRRHFAERREVLRPLREGVRAARRDFETELVADPFDKAKLQAAHQRFVEAESKLRLAGGQVIADMAASMTAEERRGFTKWRGRFRGHGGPRGHEEGGDPPADGVRKH
jgi:uncharacterized membrane protein